MDDPQSSASMQPISGNILEYDFFKYYCCEVMFGNDTQTCEKMQGLISSCSRKFKNMQKNSKEMDETDWTKLWDLTLAQVYEEFNETQQPKDEQNYPTESLWMIVSLSIVYGFLTLFAFFGNVVVIWIITTGRRMRTVMNIYISNLAMADVINSVFCIPFQFQAALLNRCGHYRQFLHLI